jgi:plasmid stability protein
MAKSQPLTVHLPDRLYSRLEARASESNRTVEAELIEVLSTAIPAEFEMTPELGKELALLDQLDDASLWRTMREMLPAETSARLEQMHLKQRGEGLSETETHALADLVRQYERTMLVRSRAAMLLKHRGHDVSKLVASE